MFGLPLKDGHGWPGVDMTSNLRIYGTLTRKITHATHLGDFDDERQVFGRPIRLQKQLGR
jgi:hypothetical protein